MKQPDRKRITSLEDVPNIGPAIAELLRRSSILSPNDLENHDPFDLYHTVCAVENKRIDPCVLDVFLAAAEFLRGGPARPWWTFTAERKALMKRKSDMP